MTTPTAFVKTLIPSRNAITGPVATIAACDASNGNSIVATGTEVCVVTNSDSGSHTFTITGQPDRRGRSADFTKSIGAGATIVTPVLVQDLWADNTGLIQLPTSNDVTLMVTASTHSKNNDKATTALTKTLLTNENDLGGVTLVFSTLDGSNGNSVVATDTEYIIFYNSTGAPITATITGQPDEEGRTGTFSKAVPATGWAVLPRLRKSLWANSSGLIILPSTNGSSLKAAVIYGP